MRSTVTSTALRMLATRSWVMERSGVMPVIFNAIALASLRAHRHLDLATLVTHLQLRRCGGDEHAFIQLRAGAAQRLLEHSKVENCAVLAHRAMRAQAHPVVVAVQALRAALENAEVRCRET